MKKMFLLAAAVCAAFTANAEKVLQVDTIFTDDFSSLVENRYTFTSPGDKIAVNNGVLQMNCPKDKSKAQNIAVAEYGLAEDTKLNEMEADSLVWVFNVRQNFNQTMTGFDSNARGYAVMLIADGNDLTTANGYAVVLGGNSKAQCRLAKVTGGLLGNSHIEDVIAGQEIGTSTGNDYRQWFTIRIVYVPATKTWKMQETSVPQQTGAAFIAPKDVETWTEDGSAEEDSFGATLLKYFGFYHNYNGSQTFNVFFDNFTLSSYKMVDVTPTAVENTQAEKHCYKTIENGQVILVRDGVKYSILGNAL